MLSLKFLRSFYIYNFLLIFLFSVTINSLNTFYLINIISFVIFHYVIIYLALYYYRKIIYIIFFIFGLGFDICLINQIGPHLMVFMLTLFFLNLTKRLYKNLDSIKVYFLIIFTIILMLSLEMLLNKLFFGYNLNIDNYLKFIMISTIVSFPIFFIFAKIDKFN